MGCSSSQGGIRERLAAAEANVACARWRSSDGQVWDLQLLERSVAEHNELHRSAVGMLEESDEFRRVKRLGNQLAHDITGMLDVKLLQRHDLAAIQTLLRLAKELESAGAANAQERADAKYKECQKEFSKERLREAEEKVQRIAQATSLPDDSEKVLSMLKDTNAHLADVPELVPTFFQCCTALSEKIVELLSNPVTFDGRKVRRLKDVARSIDGMCADLATSGHEANWALLLPRVQDFGNKTAATVLPSKLFALELEVKKKDISLNGLTDRLKDVALLWTAPSLADMARLDNCLACMEERISRGFDQVLESGQTTRQDDLITIATGFDEHCSLIQRNLEDVRKWKVREPLAANLGKKRAGLVLKTLLAAADGNVSRRTKSLEKANAKAWEDIKKLPKDALGKRAQSARWSFKLAGGDFRQFDEEKCAEVEKLYQTWVQGGRSKEPSARRKEIAVMVSVRRPRCKYGASCYRKSSDHTNEFSHPGDDDWVQGGADDSAPPRQSIISLDTGLPPRTSLRGERFCLDFQLMTQVRCTGGRRYGGQRPVKRDEGMTWAHKHTHKYYEEIMEFLNELETDFFGDAEVQLRILGSEGQPIRQHVDRLLQAAEAPVRKFLELAVYCKDKDSLKAIEQVEALLGTHGERLGVKASLKDSYLSDILDDLRRAYCESRVEDKAARKWALLRLLCKRQAVGPNNLLVCRLALVKARKDHETAKREHLHMRCLGLLTSYASDEEFARQFRQQAGDILIEAASQAADCHLIEVMYSILRTAVSWHCDVGPLERLTGKVIIDLIRISCKSKWEPNPIVRFIEILQIGHTIAQTSGANTLQKLCDLRPELEQIAGKVIGEIKLLVDKDAGSMPASVGQIVELRTKIHDAAVIQAFDQKFWHLFASEYKAAKTTRITEWAIAYCEQLRVDIPSWMMNKNQVEAHNKLQAAVSSKDEQLIREAVVFARQTEYTANEKLKVLYEESVHTLRKLKRLPTGWEVTELVGVDAHAKMFKKVNVNGEHIKALFQKVLTDTKKGIVTRDRDGAVPRDFRVDEITSVMNAESWGAYLERLDSVGEECKKFPEAVWESSGGKIEKIETEDISKEILKTTMLPELSPRSNEFLLFHGTNPTAADSIAQNNFDMAFACKTGLFGAGLYFAESSTKSDEYVKPDDDNRYPVIICRVTLGHINYCDSRDPIKHPGRDKLESSCVGGEYHSVLGDRKKVRGTYREFIVYNQHQVYPHFIVWYRRL